MSMFDPAKLFAGMPRSVKRKMIGTLAGFLKKLIREGHKDEELQAGEEDFGVVLFQTDRTNPDSPLMAMIVSIDNQAKPMRYIKTYDMDNLTNQLTEHI